ncbi:MAG TPA: MGMT family protein [Crocinitomix sp.]|nr:MGMT family protein [Crocinitomix sp.]
MNESNINFYQNIYDLVQLIPRGRVTTYGAIANYLGAKQSSRVVGWALNQCHTQKMKIPAHRVVNRLGLLSGKAHFTPPELMQQLLEQEGIVVENDKIQNFDKVFWNPILEL